MTLLGKLLLLAMLCIAWRLIISIRNFELPDIDDVEDEYGTSYDEN